MSAPRVRRHSLPDDVERIGELHRRLYIERYGLDESFVADVESAAAAALARGWPTEREGAWLVERVPGGRLSGAVALIDESGGGVATIRWVCLDPELRGEGLGRGLITAAFEHARAAGFERIELGTFSDLRDAARIYLSLGFRVDREETGWRWGRELTYQRYGVEVGTAQGRAGLTRIAG